MKKLLRNPYKGMSKKWWHRLIKVTFIFTALFIAIISYGLNYDNVYLFEKEAYTSEITLREYAEGYEGDEKNIATAFFNYPYGTLGCKPNDGKYVIDYDPSGYYPHKYNVFCTNDIENGREHLKNWVTLSAVINDTPFPAGFWEGVEAHEWLENKIAEQEDGLVCSVHKSHFCGGEKGNTIRYQPNILYYAAMWGKTLFFGTLYTGLYILIAWLIYTRLILYIIYGDKNKK